ncbi:unnamed protein product [Diplocarpon coronariae]
MFGWSIARDALGMGKADAFLYHALMHLPSPSPHARLPGALSLMLCQASISLSLAMTSSVYQGPRYPLKKPAQVLLEIWGSLLTWP